MPLRLLNARSVRSKIRLGAVICTTLVATDTIVSLERATCPIASEIIPSSGCELAADSASSLSKTWMMLICIVTR